MTKIKITIPARTVTTTIPAQTLTTVIPAEEIEVEIGLPDIEPPVVVDPPVVVEPPVVVGTLKGDAAKIGTNTFHWAPISKLSAIKLFRAYISMNWVWSAKGLYVEPMAQANKPPLANGFDEFFQKCKDAGIDPLPCPNKTPEWFRPTGDGTGANNFPPIKPGLNRTDPNSYSEVADFFFQFAARYGSKVHPDSVLRVDPTSRWTGDWPNVKKSGLNLIKYLEVLNEPDRWWDKGTEKYSEPEEYAACLSACYDAIKRADPALKVVMAGLTGLDVVYLTRMQTWFSKNRPDKKFACDVVNVHHYSNVGNNPAKWPPTWLESGAAMPEKDAAFMPGFQSVIAFAKSIGLPVWCTEFGADSRGPSQMHVKGDEEAQAELIVRSMLMHLAVGVQRTYVFNSINEPGENGGGLWSNCGLLTGEGSTTPFTAKPSYNLVAWLIAELNGYTYARDESNSAAKVLIFKDGAKEKAFYWAIDSGAEISVFGQKIKAENKVKALNK